MQKGLLLFVLLAFGFAFSGCAVGPLVSHETARTVGDGRSELIGGYGNAGAVLKFNYGLTQNWDLGLHLESLSTGIRTKYAFINGASGGWSLAGAFGIGSSVGGSHRYFDLVGSYLHKWFEPYGTFRMVHVHNDPLDFKNENTGEIDFHVNASEYDYGQFILGSRFWMTDHLMLSAEISTLSSFTSGLSFGHSFLAGLALGYKF